MAKDSFLMYTEWGNQIKRLTYEQAGILVNAIFAYESGSQIPDMDDKTEMCFAFIQGQLDRDSRKYDVVCEKRRISGKKGGIANATKMKQMVANGSKSKQSVANQADNEYEYDNEYDHDNDHDDDEERKIKERKRLEERDRILEEDDYALRHETDPNREHFFKPRVKLGWVGQDQEEEKAAVPDNRKPITQEEKDRILKRLEEFKKQRGY